MANIFINDPAQVKAGIESAASGATIYLPDMTFTLPTTVHIPDGVQVRGRTNTVVHYENPKFDYAFDISNCSDSRIANIVFDLGAGGGGIYGLGAHDVTLDHLTVLGPLYEAKSQAESSNLAVFVDSSESVSIRECAVFNSTGGFYAEHSNQTIITQNICEHTNFGQIVVSGTDITVSYNHVSYSGVPSANGAIARQGDSFTSYGSTDLLLLGNLFQNAKCYQMAFWDGANHNITISDNVIEQGITNAVYFRTDGSDVLIDHNSFEQNAGLGVFFEHAADQITVTNNVFVDDGMLFRADSSMVYIAGNDLLTGPSSSYTLPDLLSTQDLIIPGVLEGKGDFIDLTAPHGGDAGARIIAPQLELPFALPQEVVLDAGSAESVSKIISFQPSDVAEFQFVDGGTERGGAQFVLQGIPQADTLVTVGANELSSLEIQAGSFSDTQNVYVRALSAGMWSDWASFSLFTPADQSGNDYYLVDDSNDPTYEAPGGGTDIVESTAVFYQLEANVENLNLLAGATNGYGNELNNRILGNNSANVLAGLDGDDVLYGNAGDDLIYGNAGNDVLVGNEGSDTLIGGAGNDTYYVLDLADTVIELPNDGADMVWSYVSGYTLAPNVEYLSLMPRTIAAAGNSLDNWIGGNPEDNVILGGDGNDELQGMAGNDTLYGDNGNDRLIGGNGSDTLVGGEGNDSYYVDQIDDAIIELPNQGRDMIYTTAPSYRAPAQTEDMTMQGPAVEGYGNSLANWIGGNVLDNVLSGGGGNDELHGGLGNDRLWGDAGNDKLFGEVGNDSLYGGGGDDILVGGEGSDVFVIKDAFGADRIVDFQPGADRIAFAKTVFQDFSAVMAAAHQVGSSLIISDAAMDVLTISDASVAVLHSSDFIFF